MHHLPDGFDVSIFQGRSIDMVCLGSSILAVHFDRSLSVTIEGSIGLGRSGNASSVHQVPICTLQVFEIIGQQVARCERFDEGSIRLHLANGMFVEFLEDSHAFECYTIRLGDGSIIV